MFINALNLQRHAAEFWRIVRFGIVGVGASLTHVVCASLAVHFNVLPAIAFLMGFAPGFAVSYLGHRYFTFGQGSKGALGRYLVVALVGLCVGEAVLHLTEGHVGVYARMIISVMVVPMATYLAGRFWAFRTPADAVA